jgi:hypothetical protein
MLLYKKLILNSKETLLSLAIRKNFKRISNKKHKNLIDKTINKVYLMTH